MAKELIINASLPEVRIALLEEGRIQELLIERASEKGIVGNIYKGKVTRVLPGMQAAFVDIGLDKAAFLYVDDIYVHPKVMGEETEIEEDEEADETAEDATEKGSNPDAVQASAQAVDDGSELLNADYAEGLEFDRDELSDESSDEHDSEED